MQYKLKIEQRHIDAGKCSQAYNCAVSLAAQEAFGKQYVGVTHVDIRISDDRDREIGHFIDHDGCEFVSMFDNNRDACVPTTINLEIPEKAAKYLGIEDPCHAI